MRRKANAVTTLVGLGALAFLMLGGTRASAACCAAATDGEEDQSVKVVVMEGDDEGERYAEVLREDGATSAYLGVSVEEETENPAGGARVERVVDDSPAERAGIREGDVILRFGEFAVHGPVALTKRIRAAKPGDTVEIRVLRDGKQETLTAELGERPGLLKLFVGPGEDRALSLLWQGNALGDEYRESAEEYGDRLKELKELELSIPKMRLNRLFYLGSRPRLGVQLVPDVTPELREHLGAPRDSGVLVGKVLRGMPAEQAGIRVGDVIVAVDGEKVADAGELIDVLESATGKSIEIELVRDGKTLRVEAFLPELDEDDEPTGPRA